MKWKRVVEVPRHTRHDVARDVDEELRFHLRAREDDLVAAGLSREAACARAREEFGDIDDAREYATSIDHRTATTHRRKDAMQDLRQDIAYAFRQLRRTPGFACAAIATLALGIGATTSIFSVVNGVLLRPLSFPQPGQLYRVWTANRTAGNLQAPVSAVDLDDWRAQRAQIADIGGHWHSDGASGLDLTGDGEPQRLSAVFVTPGFFSALGVHPLHGRLPRNDELVRGGPDRIVLLTESFWRRQYGGRRDVVGSAITLNGEPFTVIGVLPRTFTYPTPTADAFASFSIFADDDIPRLRFVRILSVVARARAEASASAVGAEMQTITKRLAARYPENAAWDHATVMPLREAITGDVSRSLWVLLGAVAMLLLIACVNVASLQLARASTRAGEVAVRTALGATRGRLVRQLLTESVVLSVLGGLAGALMAAGTVRGIVALATGQLPRASDVTVDNTVLGFALLLSLATGVLFGLFPSWRAARDLQPAMRAARGATEPARMRLRHGLVVAEVALAMVLVIAGGLMLRSYQALHRVDPGFRAEGLLALNFTISEERHGDNYRQIYARILERVRALSGVVAAGGAKDAPFRGAGESVGFRLPGMVVPAGEDPPLAAALHISDGYFHALGARLMGGREFLPTDRQDAPPVVVVNESFARRWFPGSEAVGKRLVFGESTSAEIVGVVNDIRQTDVASDAAETLYFHVQQNGRVRMNLIARTTGSPLAMAPAVRAAILEIDPLQAITAVFTMEEAVSDALARPRLVTALLAAFGLTGLLLGALGLYGVLAYLVQQRRRDIGVRLALGAPRRRVLGMIVGQGLRLTGAGMIIGTAVSLAIRRLLSSMLYGVTTTDPLTYLGVTGVLFATAWVACLLPARRAAGVDVVTTLRND